MKVCFYLYQIYLFHINIISYVSVCVNICSVFCKKICASNSSLEVTRMRRAVIQIYHIPHRSSRNNIAIKKCLVYIRYWIGLFSAHQYAPLYPGILVLKNGSKESPITVPIFGSSLGNILQKFSVVLSFVWPRIADIASMEKS